MKYVTLILASIGWSLQASGQTIYVNGTCGNDAWTGVSPLCAAPNGPKQTIQAAIPTDFSNLTILVEAGTYVGTVQYTPPFSPNPPARTLTIESTAGAIVDGGGAGTAINFSGFDRGFVILRRLTLQNAGTGLSSHYREQVQMFNCAVRNCGTGIQNGGALTAWDTIIENNTGSPVVAPALLERIGGTTLNRSIVRNNGGVISAGNRSGGLSMSDSLVFRNGTGTDAFVSVGLGSGVTLRNTTITGSAGPAVSGVTTGGFAPTRVYARNCILWDNNSGGSQIVLSSGSGGSFDVDVQYSIVQGGYAGDGNLPSDPLFVNASGDDYHLAGGSPAIDSGNAYLVPISATIDLDGQPRIADDPATPNMGAPFPTYVDRGPYESAGTPYCQGDLDDDHDVDLNDLASLLSQFGTSGVGLAGDQDHSGSVDLSDLTILLSAFGLPCP